MVSLAMPDRPARRTAPRARSVHHPGVTLDEALAFVQKLDEHGLDGADARTIAETLGYTNIKSHAVSVPLSASRQFGLLALERGRYRLTPRARRLRHPVDRNETSRLRRECVLAPPLYADLASALAGQPLPARASLANRLQLHHRITAAAKNEAARVFLESCEQAGLVTPDGRLRLDPPRDENSYAFDAATPRVPGGSVRFTLPLWGDDEGGFISVEAPRQISAESHARLIEALRLHILVRDPAPRSG